MHFFYLFDFLITRRTSIVNAARVEINTEQKDDNIHNTRKEDNYIETNKTSNGKSYPDDTHNVKKDLNKTEYDKLPESSKDPDKIPMIKKNSKKKIKDESKFDIKPSGFTKVKTSLSELDICRLFSLRSNIIKVYEKRNYCKSINGLKALKLSLENQLKMIKYHYSKIKQSLSTRIFYNQSEMDGLISAWKCFEKNCDDIIQTKNAYFIWTDSEYTGKKINPLKPSSIIDFQKSKCFLLSLTGYKITLINMKSIKFFHPKNILKIFRNKNLSKTVDKIETSLEIIKAFESNKMVLPYGQFYPIDTFESSLTQYMQKIKSANIRETEVEKFNLCVDKISEFNRLLTLIYEEIYRSGSIYSGNCNIALKKDYDLLINLDNSIYSIMGFTNEMLLINLRYDITTNYYESCILFEIIIGYLQSQIYTDYMEEIMILKLALESIIPTLNVNS